jgi:murein DD-endopeptidase MepM/ murein hydrolase activator NlpD
VSRRGPVDPADTLTLMVVPGRTGHIRRYSLPQRWIRLGGGAVVAFALLLIVGAVDYVRVRTMLSELDGLRTETREQRSEIQAYAEHMQKISDELARVGEFDRKLRVIANLEPGNAAELPGIGGIDPDGISLGRTAGLTRSRRQERMIGGLENLGDAADRRGESLAALIDHLEDQTARLAATPSISPTKGWVTSTFGYRTSPFTGLRELHRGLDIAGRNGTPILASADARVRIAQDHRGMGKMVILKHGHGVETMYGHLSEILVKPGQQVTRGERIGLMGSTGRSTGPHVHYQINVNGVAVNPNNYILD